jgi:cytochrome c-type biogenesis protein CcmH
LIVRVLLCVALADAPAAEDLGDIGTPGVAPPVREVEERTHDLAKQLRCPVCQGLSVADSPSDSALDMKGRIQDLVAQGYSDEQIVDYFVSRYGEWILLSPDPKRNWLVWLAPGLAAGIGLAWAAATVVSWRKEPERLPSDTGELPKDAYEERLLKEMDE